MGGGGGGVCESGLHGCWNMLFATDDCVVLDVDTAIYVIGVCVCKRMGVFFPRFGCEEYRAWVSA